MSQQHPSRIEIRPITAEATVHIRHTVLWPSVPLSAQLLPWDALPSTLHFGAFLLPSSSDSSFSPSTSTRGSGDGDIIGVLSITTEAFKFPQRLPERLRALAAEGKLAYRQLHKFGVLQQYQGRGIGKALLEGAIAQLVHRSEIPEAGQPRPDATLFHFDARAAQAGFYEKLGFDILDEERFLKYGPTGDAPGVEYVRMGRLLD